MAIVTTECSVETRPITLLAIVAALNAASLITETKFQDSENIVFTTPLTSKVIKLGVIQHQQVYVAFGTAWTSGTTITNEARFSVAGYDWATLLGVKVITSTNYFCIISLCPENEQIMYLGELSNGNKLCFGLQSRTDGGYGLNYAYNLTTGDPLIPISFSCNISFRNKTTGAMFSMPLMWTTPTGDLQMDGTDPAGTEGIRVSSYFPRGADRNIAMFGGDGYILTTAPLYRAGRSDFSFQNALIIPTE